MKNTKNSKSKSMDAGQRMSFMRMTMDRMRNDYFLLSEKKTTNKYFNPRHFQIQDFMQRGDLVVVVEHCSLCTRHVDILRHDERRYISEGNKVIREVCKQIHAGRYNLRLGAVRVPVMPTEKTVGCFEISLIYQNRGGQYYNKLIYSKLEKRKWPVEADIEAKLSSFFENAKLTTVPPKEGNKEVGYFGSEIGGISSFPVGGQGPWESTPVGASSAPYPNGKANALLAAPIVFNDVWWCFDSRSDVDLDSAPSLGSVVWVRGISSLSGGRERHEQLAVVSGAACLNVDGIVSGDVLSPPSPMPVALSPAASRSASPTFESSQPFKAIGGSLSIGVKLKYFNESIRVDVRACVPDSEHIPRLPYTLQAVPLELETLIFLALIFADRLNRGEAAAQLQSSPTSPVIQDSRPHVASPFSDRGESSLWYSGWCARSPSDVVESDGKLMLCRTSLYHELRTLVSNIEGILLEDGNMSPDKVTVKHRRTGRQLDLQICYDEAILDWIFGKFGPTHVNVYEMQQFVIDQELSRTEEAIAMQLGSPQSRCGDTDSPGFRVEIQEHSIDEYMVQSVNHYYLKKTIAAVLESPNVRERIRGEIAAFHWILGSTCQFLALDKRRRENLQCASTSTPTQTASLDIEVLSQMNASGELRHVLTMILEHFAAEKIGDATRRKFGDFDPSVIETILFRTRNYPADEAFSSEVLDILLHSIDNNGSGYVSATKLSKFLLTWNAVGKGIGEIWTFLHGHFINPAVLPISSTASLDSSTDTSTLHWGKLVELLVSEGLSSFLQSTDDSNFLSFGWMTEDLAAITAEAFSSILCQLNVLMTITPVDLDCVVTNFAVAKTTTHFEAISLDDDAPAALTASQKYRGVLGSEVTSGTAEVVFVEWFKFLTWVLFPCDLSMTSRSERLQELETNIFTIAQKLAPFSNVSLPEDSFRRPRTPDNLCHHTDEVLTDHPDRLSGSPVQFDEDMYGGDWETDSIKDANNEAVVHSGYSNYDGESIESGEIMPSLDGKDGGPESPPHDKVLTKPSVIVDTADIKPQKAESSEAAKSPDALRSPYSSLHDLINELDAVLKEDKARKEQKKLRMDSNLSVLGDHNSSPGTSDVGAKREKVPRAQSAGGASVSERSTQNSTGLALRPRSCVPRGPPEDLPRKVAFTRLELFGPILRAVMEANAQKSYSFRVGITVGEAVLTGSVDMSGITDTSSFGAICFDLTLEMDGEASDSIVKSVSSPALDMQDIQSIQVSLSTVLQGADPKSSTVPVWIPVNLSTKRFLEIKKDSFRLDFDVYPKFAESIPSTEEVKITDGDELDERLRVHLSVGGTSCDLDNVARTKWSERRTPHFAIINRLPDYVKSIVKADMKPSKRRQAPTHSLMTPWFPAATNNDKIPGMVRLGEQRPLSPSWHPVALGNRDPFSNGRTWNYTDEMKLRIRKEDGEESVASAMRESVTGAGYVLLKDEVPVQRPPSPTQNMLGVFLARNKYSGGPSRPIPPPPAKKPPVPHFEWTKPSTTQLFLKDDEEPRDTFVPPPRRPATPKLSDFPKIKSPSADNLADGPAYVHNRFREFSSNQIPSRLGSSIPRWPEVKQGRGNMAKPRVFPSHLKMGDSPSHYKLY